jgi:hypothetical protein
MEANPEMDRKAYELARSYLPSLRNQTACGHPTLKRRESALKEFYPGIFLVW